MASANLTGLGTCKVKVTFTPTETDDADAILHARQCTEAPLRCNAKRFDAFGTDA